jgi:hypothetical protein
VLISKEDLGICLSLSHSVTAIMSKIQDILVLLPHDALCHILQITYAVIIVALAFCVLAKGQPSHDLGFMKIHPAVPPSILCIVLILLLL